MNTEEAKFILSAYRPSGQDADDAQIHAALESLRLDPLLEEWFREEQAHDAAVASALESIAPPPALRAQILAGEHVTHFQQRRGHFPRWVQLIAAGLTLAATGLGVWHFAQTSTGSKPIAGVDRLTELPTEWPEKALANWQVGALDALEAVGGKHTPFDAVSRDPNVLMQWLANTKNPGGEKGAFLPLDLDRLASIGCKTITVGGTPVSILCFQLPGGGGEIHLAIARRDSASDAPPKDAPMLYAKHGAWKTAQWSQGDHWMILASQADNESLNEFVKSRQHVL